MKTTIKLLGYGLLTVLVALLVVPFLLPQSGSGTLDHRQSAGPDAVFVEINGLEVHVQHTPYTGADSNPPLLVLLDPIRTHCDDKINVFQRTSRDFR
ncbi:MAG: hypothetical protein O3B02_07765 [Proteobacteria bacterium]|nr:hypothetical protein [Pseudomonadota bacterium]